MCSTSEDVQCEQGYAVRVRDVQYESRTSSVQARMCGTNKAHLQYEQLRCIKTCMAREGP